MSRRDDSLPIRHMLDYAKTACRLAQGRIRSDLDQDEALRLALTRAIEVIGEAAYRVSSSIKEHHTGIPWTQIIATRHHLIHGYDQVDHQVLWDIVTHDLPPLIDKLTAILTDG